MQTGSKRRIITATAGRTGPRGAGQRDVSQCALIGRNTAIGILCTAEKTTVLAIICNDEAAIDVHQEAIVRTNPEFVCACRWDINLGSNSDEVEVLLREAGDPIMKTSRRGAAPGICVGRIALITATNRQQC